MKLMANAILHLKKSNLCRNESLKSFYLYLWVSVYVCLSDCRVINWQNSEYAEREQ